VVGADGLMSVVRRLFSQDVPVQSEYVAYRGAIPLRAATRPSALDEVVGWIGPGLHFVQYALHESDLYNQVAVFRSEEARSGVSDWGSPAELDRRFQIACEPVRLALQAINRDQRWYMSDREPLSAWSHGRVTLLGDAAHPMLQYLAQGACQALEDAAALGGAVADCTAGGEQPDGLPKALLAYQDARIKQATRVQRGARLWGDIWHTSDHVALALRSALFQSRPAADYQFTDWLYHPADGQP
jgi:salicylate hydroxylase